MPHPESQLRSETLKGVGADVDKQLHASFKAAAKHFDKVGAHGLQVWRLDGHTVVPVPESLHGTFFSAHCYIVLNSGGKHDIHAWIGKDSTTTEGITAAFFAVIVDEYLESKATTYREIQGSESTQFTSYFSMVELDGKVADDFHKTQPEKYKPRLLKIFGDRTARLREVPFTYRSLNKSDVFILDQGKTLTQWNGPKAHPFERSLANQRCQLIESDRAGLVKRIVIEGDAVTSADAFWKALGGTKDKYVVVPDADGTAAKIGKRVYRLVDRSGEGKFEVELLAGATELPNGEPTKILLLVENDFTVQCRVGVNCKAKERFYAGAMMAQILQLVNASPVAVVTITKQVPWHEKDKK